MAEDNVQGDLDIVDEGEDAVEQSESANNEAGPEKIKKEEGEKGAGKRRIFDADRFDFSGQCDVCHAGLIDGKDHMEFLIERICAPTRSSFYRNVIWKHWPDFQGLSMNMQPFCSVCQKHFWGVPDITRHVYCMAVYGVEDVRQLEDYTDTEVKKEETTKKEETAKEEETTKKEETAKKEETTKEKTTPTSVEEKKPGEEAKDANTKNQKNKNRMKRRRQAYADALEAEFQIRIKRAEEIAASLPEEEIPDEAQREANKESHAPLYKTIRKLIDMGSAKEPTEDAIELLNQIICGQSPRWFEASYLLGGYEIKTKQQDSSPSAQQDLTSARSNVTLLDARWRLSKNEMDESSYLELAGKLKKQSERSTDDSERALREIAEKGELWKDDECSPSGETFTCLVCNKKGRSLRIHLIEAFWLTKVNSVFDKSTDLPECPILTEVFLTEMKSNSVMAHVYHYLGEKCTRRFIEDLSFKTNRVLRCPGCLTHYRALKCCLPELFKHIQTCGFLNIDGEFKDAHQTVALRIASILAEARSGVRSTSSIVDELIDYLSCNEGGLHLQKRGSVTIDIIKSSPRIMAKIRQSVTRKLKEESKAATSAKKAKVTVKTATTAPVKTGKPAVSRPAARDALRGVQQTTQMKSKNPIVIGRGRGFRSNGVGASGVSTMAMRGGRGVGVPVARGRIPQLMANQGTMVTQFSVGVRSAPVGRIGYFSGGISGGRSQPDMNQINKVGVYCELCSQEFYGFNFNEANQLLHAHLVEAIFRCRRELGKMNMAAQHLKCFPSHLVYATVSFCPACQLTRSSLDAILNHINQVAGSSDVTAVQHKNLANDVISQFVECMNGTMSLVDLSIYVQKRFIR